MVMTKQELIQALSEETILELTGQLVAIPTPNPPGREKDCAAFIFKILQEWGLEVEMVYAPEPERPQLVAWRRGDGDGPTVILNGHMDTVGEGDRSAWQEPPFRATRRANRLYGLGTCDMKGSLAIGMAILQTLRKTGATFPGTLMFQAAMGEEMDEPGTRTLLQKGYTGDYAIVMEPTDLRVGPASRGVAWYKITLTGPSVHCGLAPPEAPDLMTHFARLGLAIADYHRQISVKTHSLAPSPSCRITQTQAGHAHNSTAGYCRCVIDRRMLPGETLEQVTAEVADILEQLKSGTPDFEYRLEFLAWNEPVETPLDSPLIEVLQQNVREIGGREPEIWGPPYGSDLRNFVYDAGIPAVNFGAGDYRVCHQPNEFVPVDDLLTGARVIFGTVIDLLGSEPTGSRSNRPAGDDNDN